MRFALVAGALVLGATVTEARSIAPSPSKRSNEKIEFSTPSRMHKRARPEDSEWNPAAESEDNQDGMDPAAYQAKTPKAGKAHKTSKLHHDSSDPDVVYRTTLFDALGSSSDPVATQSRPTAEKLPQEIQYQIIPVSPANVSASNTPISDSRAYIIKPVTPSAALVDPVDVKPTGEGGISSPDLSGMVNHLKTKEDSQPALELLRAIENYRMAVSQQDHPRSRAAKPSNSSSEDSPPSIFLDSTKNSTLSEPNQSANSTSTDADEPAWNQ